MSAVRRAFETNLLDPAFDDTSVLPSTKMRRFLQSAQKQKIITFQLATLIHASSASRVEAVISN
jgi:hypothetical protein